MTQQQQALGMGAANARGRLDRDDLRAARSSSREPDGPAQRTVTCRQDIVKWPREASREGGRKKKAKPSGGADARFPDRVTKRRRQLLR